MGTSTRANIELKPDGLTWLSGLNQDWRNKEGRPNLSAIAEVGGLNRSTLTNVASGRQHIGAPTMATLLHAARTSGINPAEAFNNLFVLDGPVSEAA